jgi:transcriptional regulator with XRE-family HTH domain
MAKQGEDLASTAANLVILSDIAVRTGSPEDAVSEWVTMPGFPQPLIAVGAGARVWWWPDVRKFVLARAAKLPGYVPPGAEFGPPMARPRPKGKRGPNPGPRALSPFDIRQIRAMHAQHDDQARPRFTFRQIAATLPGGVSAMTVHTYVETRRRPPGLGGDARTLPPERIAELRALRAERTADGKFRYTLRELSKRFGVSDMTVSRYCRDIGPVTRRRRTRPLTDAEGNEITVEQVQRVQAMRAERDGAGLHRYTPEQVAAACGVSVATVKRLVRGLT